jgi:hypothetical protein
VLDYYHAITVIDAEEMLNSIKVSAYPNMTDDSKSKIHRELSKMAHPEHLQKQMDFEDFIRKMNGR